jgi:hypothetical protein
MRLRRSWPLSFVKTFVERELGYALSANHRRVGSRRQPTVPVCPPRTTAWKGLRVRDTRTVTRANSLVSTSEQEDRASYPRRDAASSESSPLRRVSAVPTEINDEHKARRISLSINNGRRVTMQLQQSCCSAEELPA